MADLASVFAGMKEKFQQKSGASGLEGKRIQFHIAGDGGGAFLLAVDGGELSINPGEDGTADLSVSVAKDDFLALTEGRLGPMQAFMTGKIKVKGDMSVAMKMQTLLS